MIPYAQSFIFIFYAKNANDMTSFIILTRNKTEKKRQHYVLEEILPILMVKNVLF